MSSISGRPKSISDIYSDVNCHNHKFYNAQNGSNPQDLVTMAQLGSSTNQPLNVIATNFPNTGNVPWNGVKLTSLANGTNPNDAVNFSQLGSTNQPLNVIATNNPNTNSVPFNNKKLTGLLAGSSTNDAVNYGQLTTFVQSSIISPDGGTNLQATNTGLTSNLEFQPSALQIQMNGGLTDIQINTSFPTILNNQISYDGTVAISTPQQLVNKTYVDTSFMPITNSLATISATNPSLSNITASSQQIKNLAPSTTGTDAINRNELNADYKDRIQTTSINNQILVADSDNSASFKLANVADVIKFNSDGSTYINAFLKYSPTFMYNGMGGGNQNFFAIRGSSINDQRGLLFLTQDETNPLTDSYQGVLCGTSAGNSCVFASGHLNAFNYFGEGINQIQLSFLGSTTSANQVLYQSSGQAFTSDNDFRMYTTGGATAFSIPIPAMYNCKTGYLPSAGITVTENTQFTDVNYTESRYYTNVTTLNNILQPNGNLNMNGFKITFLNSTPTGSQDAVPLGYLQSLYRLIASSLATISTSAPALSSIDANNQKIINLLTPTSNFDASTKKYVDDSISAILPQSHIQNTLTNLDVTAGGALEFSANGNTNLLRVTNTGFTDLEYDQSTGSATWDVNGDFFVKYNSLTNANFTISNTSVHPTLSLSGSGDTASLILQGSGTGLKFTNSANKYSFNSGRISDVLDPLLAQDVATKQYVDTMAGSSDRIISGISNNIISASSLTLTIAGTLLTTESIVSLAYQMAYVTNPVFLINTGNSPTASLFSIKGNASSSALTSVDIISQNTASQPTFRMNNSVNGFTTSMFQNVLGELILSSGNAGGTKIIRAGATGNHYIYGQTLTSEPTSYINIASGDIRYALSGSAGTFIQSSDTTSQYSANNASSLTKIINSLAVSTETAISTAYTTVIKQPNVITYVNDNASGSAQNVIFYSNSGNTSSLALAVVSQNATAKPILRLQNDGTSRTSEILMDNGGNVLMSASNSKFYLGSVASPLQSMYLTEDLTNVKSAMNLGASDLRYLNPTIISFTSTTTWTVPALAQHPSVIVQMVGGGASGAGSGANTSANGGSGGSGAYIYAIIDLTGISSVTITIGSGGSAPSAGQNNGNNGGNSAFGYTGVTLTAQGGKAGLANGTQQSGSTFSASGISSFYGRDGSTSGAGCIHANGNINSCRGGGDSFFGIGAIWPYSSTIPSSNGGNSPSSTQYGGAGSGANNINVVTTPASAGGAGISGVCYVNY